jgi:methylated-DNA-[protein]-cysteine S-methyltransferase
MIHTLALDSPVGRLALREEDGSIVAVRWRAPAPHDPSPLLHEAARQLEAYFAKRLAAFDLPLAPAGDAFSKQVWAAMREIPFGGTRTYGEIAAALGGQAQDVGIACGRNPIPILIPCHRVTAAGGKLGGYSGAGGLRTKRFLLALEAPEFALT